MESQHILLFGASGASGLAFIKHFLTLSSPPYLTLYVRSGRKLTDLAPETSKHTRIRIVEGELTSSACLANALTPPGGVPDVTAAISFLGAYMSLAGFVTRDTSTPIADAVRSTVLPALARFNVRRVLVLSTPSYLLPGEAKVITWRHYVASFFPPLVVPQGNAEMKGLARAVVEAGAEDGEWTVFRVPILDDGHEAEVVSGTFFGGYDGRTVLGRGSMVRWVLDEVVERKWVRGVPVLGNKA